MKGSLKFFPEHLALPPGKMESGLLRKVCLFWLPVVLMFLVANTGLESWEHLFRHCTESNFDLLPQSFQNKLVGKGPDYFFTKARDTFLVPLRTQLFLLGLLCLGLHVAPAFRNQFPGMIDRAILQRAALLCGAMFLLATTLKANQMGEQYAFISAEPFAQTSGYYYRRLLVPALAYFTQLKGFAAYNLFSFVLSYCLIVLTLVWFKHRGLTLSRWQEIAVFSSGLIISHFQSPGYVEQGVYISFILSLLLPLSAYGRAGLAALMLVTHEAAALAVVLPAAIFLYPKKEVTLYIGLCALYGFTWLFNFGFDLSAAIATQTSLAGISAWEYLQNKPEWALFGAFFAFKMLWLSSAIALFRLMRERDAYNACCICAFLVLPMCLSVLGVDSTRLIGFGTIGVWLALPICRNTLASPWFTLLLALNLSIPSLSYTLGQGPYLAPGLYKLVFFWAL